MAPANLASHVRFHPLRSLRAALGFRAPNLTCGGYE